MASDVDARPASDGQPAARRRPFVRPLVIVVGVLLLPLLPLLIFGDRLDAAVEEWLAVERPAGSVAAAVSGVLAVDILLPVPSSAVSTFGGAELGIAAGTAASWAGMTAGALLGFGLARALGRPLAARLSSADDLQRSETLAARYGPLVLVLLRGVPLLAEASVLLMGVARLSWRRFFWPVAWSNLGLSLAYAAFGRLAREANALPAALALSIALPVAIAVVVRWRLRPR